MNSETYILIFAICLIILGISAFYLNREVFNPEGKGAQKTTARILSRFGRIRGFKVLSNVKVGDAVIENMLIGYFGILIVRTLGDRAEFYGTLDGDQWSVAADGKKKSVDNPVKQLQKESAALRSFFSNKKLYNVPIETTCYLSSRSSKTALYITHNGEILTGGKLSSYLSTTKFEKDTGLDVKKLADALLSQ